MNTDLHSLANPLISILPPAMEISNDRSLNIRLESDSIEAPRIQVNLK
jgi:hypothetical protein